MATRARTLTTAEAKAFYDRLGARQDTQAFYEDRAVAALIAHADFAHARSIVELGCGTGRVAARILGTVAPAECRYLGIDVSDTMIGLARERLRPWANRARVVRSGGILPADIEAGAHDRFLSTYVLDLMSEDAIRAVLTDAHRVLAADGRLCLVGLTRGRGVAAGLVSRAWALVHRLEPKLVGGCRAIELCDYLPPAQWRMDHREVVSPWALSSEVVVAAPRFL
jgi:SAM-dependent methyltransferase